MLGELITWLIETVSALGYPGIVVLMAIESSIIPLPSELVMPPAGYLAAKGRMDPFIAVLAGTLGSVLGALVNYWLAVRVGEPVLRRFGKYVLISNKSLDKTEAYFLRHGEISTFVGRLLPVIRTFIAFPAGVARMNMLRFNIYTFIGSYIWCWVLAWIGMKLGQHWDTLGVYFHQFDAAIGVVLVVAIVWYIRRHLRHQKDG